MTITASMVKELRDSTGAGMMDAKKALTETNGDMEAAVDWLRTKGLAKAAKKADRVAAEGLVGVAVSGGKGVAVEVNSETDFVGKNADFQALANAIAATANAGQVGDRSALSAAALADGRTVDEAVAAMAGVIGEKIELGRVAVLPSPIALYLHRRASDLPPQVGVLVAYSGDEEAARGAAMQIAAMRPMYLSRDDVPVDVIENERRIAEATAKEEGKPEAALPKIVEGRVNGFFKDTVLLEQASVVDNKKSVAQVLSDAGTTVTGFARFEAGQ